jgi:hypothetical protein
MFVKCIGRVPIMKYALFLIQYYALLKALLFFEYEKCFVTLQCYNVYESNRTWKGRCSIRTFKP